MLCHVCMGRLCSCGLNWCFDCFSERQSVVCIHGPLCINCLHEARAHRACMRPIADVMQRIVDNAAEHRVLTGEADEQMRIAVAQERAAKARTRAADARRRAADAQVYAEEARERVMRRVAEKRRRVP